MQERPLTGDGFQREADATEQAGGRVTAGQYHQTAVNEADAWNYVGGRSSRSRPRSQPPVEQPYPHQRMPLGALDGGVGHAFAGKGRQPGLAGPMQVHGEAGAPSGRWDGVQRQRATAAPTMPASYPTSAPRGPPAPGQRAGREAGQVPAAQGMSRVPGSSAASGTEMRFTVQPTPASLQAPQPRVLLQRQQPQPQLRQAQLAPMQQSGAPPVAAAAAHAMALGNRGAEGALPSGGAPASGPFTSTAAAPHALASGPAGGGGETRPASLAASGLTGAGPRARSSADEDAGGSSRGAVRATATSGASQQERLMAQARRSAFDPATNKVRCRACGKAFPTYSQLAQHLEAAHDGINSEDAKYLQFKRQQQLQEQQQHVLQQLQAHPPDFFPSVSVAYHRQQAQHQQQQQQHQALHQQAQHQQQQQALHQQAQAQHQQQGHHHQQYPTQLQRQEHYPQQAPVRILRGDRVPSACGSEPRSGPAGGVAAPAAGSSTSAPFHDSQPVRTVHGHLTAPTRQPPQPLPPGPHPRPYSGAHPALAQAPPAQPRPAAPQGVWAHRQAATGVAMSSAGATSGQAPPAAPVAPEPTIGVITPAAAAAAAEGAVPAAATNAWAARRLQWQVAPEAAPGGATPSISASVAASQPGAVAQSSGWATVGEPKGPRGSHAARDPSWPVVGPAGPNRGPTAAQALAAAAPLSGPVKASKRVVTLAELFSAAVPGDGGRGSSAAPRGSVGAAGLGARGGAVRISNSLRVVMKAPAARPQRQLQQGAGAGTGVCGGSGGTAAAGAPVVTGKRLRLTAAGTVAAPRKKQPTRAKKLILQHRANRGLAEAATAYQRVRESYRKVAAVYGAMQAELQRLQQQGGADDDYPSASPAAVAAAVTDAAAAPTRPSAGARDIADSTSALPPRLRPQLLLLALAKIRPQLESLHRTLVRRRVAYVAKLKHHAAVHRQGEPSDAELAEQAPLDLLPPGLGAGAELPAQQQRHPAGGPASHGAEGGGGAGCEEAAEDGDSGNDSGSEVAEGFQDVLRRWAEVLRLPRKLYDLEPSPPGESPPPAIGLGRPSPVPHVMPAAVIVHSFHVSPQPDRPLAASSLSASAGNASVGPDRAAGQEYLGAAAPAAAAQPPPQPPPHSRVQPAYGTVADGGGPQAARGGTGGLSIALQAQPPGKSVGEGEARAAVPARAPASVAPKSSLPAWLAPRGDTSEEEEDEDDGPARPMGLFGGPAAVAAAAAAWRSCTVPSVPMFGGQLSKASTQPGTAPVGSGGAGVQAAAPSPPPPQPSRGTAPAAAGNAAAVAAAAGGALPGGAAAVGRAAGTAGTSTAAGQTAPPLLFAPLGPGAAAAASTSDEDDDDDDSVYGTGYGPGGWTDVLNKWQSQVSGGQAAALPLFNHTAPRMAGAGVWGIPATHPFMPSAARGSAAVAPASAAAFAAAAVAPSAAATSASMAPMAQRVAAAAAQPLTPAFLPGLIHQPSSVTLMGLPAPSPVLTMPPNPAAAAAAAAVFASAAAALAPAAAAEAGDDDDQLSPEAATAAAALILQQHEQRAHAHALVQAQAEAEAQFQQRLRPQAQPRPPLQVQGLGGQPGSVASQLDALLAAAAAATGSATAAQPFGLRAAPTAAAPPPRPPPPQPVAMSSWMQSLMTGGDDDDDDEEEEDDYGGALGGLKVDVLAGWVASANIPKIGNLFKQQQQMQQQAGFGGFSSYGVAGTGAAAAAVHGRGGAAVTGSLSAVQGAAQAPLTTGAAAPAAEAAAAAAATAAAARPAGAIKIISRALPSGPSPNTAKPPGPVVGPPQQRQQPRAAAVAAPSTSDVAGRPVRPQLGMSLPAAVAPQAAGATATAAAVAAAAAASQQPRQPQQQQQHQQRPGKQFAPATGGTAPSTVKLLTRAGIVGGPSTGAAQPSITPPGAKAPSTAVVTTPAPGVAAAAAASAAAGAQSSTHASASTGTSTGRTGSDALSSSPNTRQGPVQPIGAANAAPAATCGPSTHALPGKAPAHRPAAGVAAPPQPAPTRNAWARPLFASPGGITVAAVPAAEEPKRESGDQRAPEAAEGRAGGGPGPGGPAAEVQAGPTPAAGAAEPPAAEPPPREPQDPAQAPQQLPPEFKCELCHVHCNSRWTFEQHCASRKHVARAASTGWVMPQLERRDSDAAERDAAAADAAAGGTAAGTAGPASPYTCATCGVCCNSDLTFQQHLASRKHLARAAMRLVQRALPGSGGNAQQQQQQQAASGAAGSGAQLAPQPGAGVGDVVAGGVTESAREGGQAKGLAGPAASSVRGGGGGGAGSGSGGTAAAADAGAVSVRADPTAAVDDVAQAMTRGAAAGAGGGPRPAAAAPSSAAARAGGHGQPHRLCQQLLVPELDALVLDTLTRIRGFQERAMARNAIKAAAHRWYVLGLREVHKAVRTRRARAVVVAPNIEEVAAEGGLDTTLQAILDMCEEQGTLVVFALSRKHLGRVYGFKKRVSAVAIQELNGIHEAYGQMVRLTKDAREGWRQRGGAAADAAGGGSAAGWGPNSAEADEESDDSREADEAAEEVEQGGGAAAQQATKEQQRQAGESLESESKNGSPVQAVRQSGVGVGGSADADTASTVQRAGAAEVGEGAGGTIGSDNSSNSSSSAKGGGGKAEPAGRDTAPDAAAAPGGGRATAAAAGRALNIAARVFVPRSTSG